MAGTPAMAGRPARPLLHAGLAGGLVAGWAATVTTAPAALAASCLLGWTLLALGWIDWRTLRLPNILTLPLLLAGLVWTWLAEPAALPDHAIGAAAGYLALAGIGLAYRLWRDRDGLGLGDAKLLAAGGAWLGWQALPVTVLLAALAGLAVVLVRHLAGRQVRGDTALPFGPMLALAIWLVHLYGVPGSGY